MESRSFSSRGIQQDDVWSAADSLIADGLRPTIERVRQKIGRGSPNTVSPMLEAWFATLGTRLGINKNSDELSGIPKILQQALRDSWEIALSNSREISAQETVQARAILIQATEELNRRESEIDQAELVRTVKQQALEDALQAARNGTEVALDLLRVTQALAGRRETEIHNIQEKLAVIETERDLERRCHQTATAHDIVERQKIEERAQATQRKLLEDIDRARQEIKKAESDALAVKKQFVADKILLVERSNSCEKDTAKIKSLYAEKLSDLEALRQASVVSDSRSHELQSLLRMQLANSNNTIARLTEALLIPKNRPVKGPGLRARKVYKTIRTRKV